MLATEALHQGAHRNAIEEILMTNVLSTPLGLNAVYTIASAFIKSCPSTNAAFPVMANPSITLVPGLPTAVGAVIELKPEMVPVGDRCATFCLWLRYYCNSNPGHQERYGGGGGANEHQRTAYVFLTKDKSGRITDPNVLYSPAVIEVTRLLSLLRSCEDT